MFRFPMLMIAALSLAALSLAACGGGGDDDDAGSGGRATAVAGVPDGAPYVDQENLKFVPGKVTVTKDETVYFQNSETAIHTVTINGKNESGTMKKDDLFKWTPPAAGEYKITCEFHPQMKATITVQ